MLTLGTNLTAELKHKSTDACWLLSLYYNDDDVATNVIRLSDRDRTVGGVDYIGIVRSWGSLHHAADLIEFSSSTGTITILLDNTEHAILNGRFTDLFATKNFANRKWTIHLSDGINVSTDSIGSGIISGDIKVNDRETEIYLLNYESKFNKQIPSTVIDGAFPFAPANNIDKPIPMSYGDFSRISTDVTTHLARSLIRGKFPAIITHETNIEAKCDSVVMNDLQAGNLYMAVGDNLYGACDSGNVTATASPGAPASGYNFLFGDDDWYLYVPITFIEDVDGGIPTLDLDHLYDEDISTSGDIATQAGGVLANYKIEIPIIPNIGNFTSLYIGMDKSAISGATGEVLAYYQTSTSQGYGTARDLGWNTTDKYEIVPSGDFPQEGANVKLTIRDTLGADVHRMTINEIVIFIKFQPSETLMQRIESIYDVKGKKRRAPSSPPALLPEYWPRKKYYIVKTARTINIFAPANIDYVYCSGMGREFGAWIDTIDGNARDTENGSGSDPGYNAAALIKNPIYIAEDALRTEGGLDSGVDGSDIDIESFDIAGAAADGLIGDVFSDAISDIDFAFSQNKFIDLFSFCEKVGHQCGTLFFISGNNKMKAVVRRRPADYSAGDENMVVDYNDIRNISFNQTPIGDVRNDITVKYDYDYAKEETIESVNPAADATSYGDGLTGYNQRLYLEEIMDCCLNAVTADNYADALQAWHKDRAYTIKFETALPRYQALEIGDVFTFLNWDSDFKVYGTTPTTTDLFMIQEITKSGPEKTMIEVMEVS